MATLYFKTAGGNFNGANWSTTSAAGVDSNTPTAADNCIVELASGAMTINASSVCRSLDFTSGTGAYTNTATHTAGVTLTIGDGTAGAGNVALKLASGMTYTLGNAISSAITYASTSGTQQTITTAGKAIGNQTFSGNGGSWKYMDNITSSGGISITQSSGNSLEFNNITVAAGSYVWSGGLAKTITLGSSAFTLTANGGCLGGSGVLTFTANTATFTCTGSNNPITPNASNMNGASLVLTPGGGSSTSVDGSTWANITVNGQASKSDLFKFTAATTVTSTLTLNSNSLTNRLLVSSNTTGTPVTVTAATVTVSNVVNFMDITGAGAATWTVAGTGATALGDCQGNSGITFTTGSNRYGVAGANWSSTTAWSASSGGAPGASVPLPQDDVFFNSSTGANTVSADMPFLGHNITASAGFTGNLCSPSGTASTIFGNVTAVTGCTVGNGNFGWTFAGRGSQTIDMAGITVSHSSATNITAPGGTYTLLSAYTGAQTFNHNAGAFVTGGFTFTPSNYSHPGTTTRSLDITNSTVSLTATSISPWSVSATNFTLTSTGSTIVFTPASTSTRTFAGAGLTYNTVRYNVANSPGDLIISGSNTINTLTIGRGRYLQLTAGTTQTITNWDVTGSPYGYLRLDAVISNGAFAADSTALSITGDMTIDVQLAQDDWTPTAAFFTLVYKYSASGHSYAFATSNTNKATFLWSADGSTDKSAASTSAWAFTDGSTQWLRVSQDADNGASASATRFYSSTDGSSWVQIGSTVTTAGALSIFDSTAPLEMGYNQVSTNNPLQGNLYRVKIYNSDLQTSAGTPVFDCDFSKQTVGVDTFNEVSSNAALITINGTYAKVGDGRIALISSSAGSVATIQRNSGTNTSAYLTVKDVNAQGGNGITGSLGQIGWSPGPGSVLISNSKGWGFNTAKPPTRLRPAPFKPGIAR